MTAKTKIYTIPQAAAFCSLSRGTLWKYVKSGQLKASLTPGGHYRIREKDLEDFIHEKGMYPLSTYEPGAKKILIVDDDQAVRGLLRQILSRAGYTPETAKDGFEAGVRILEFKPGLVILDLLMPGMNGFEVCRQIRQNKTTSRTKILAVTGFDTEENRQRIMEGGADGYLAKPLEKEQVLQTVAELLQK
jgi:excisionase family DNA binding protein